MKPKRIQRKRHKGWQMPKNAVYVGRPTKWGNPFLVEEFGQHQAVFIYEQFLESALEMTEMFATYRGVPVDVSIIGDFEELRGKDLACWCPLDKPCHADVLLMQANV